MRAAETANPKEIFLKNDDGAFWKSFTPKLILFFINTLLQQQHKRLFFLFISKLTIIFYRILLPLQFSVLFFIKFYWRLFEFLAFLCQWSCCCRRWVFVNECNSFWRENVWSMIRGKVFLKMHFCSENIENACEGVNNILSKIHYYSCWYIARYNR